MKKPGIFNGALTGFLLAIPIVAFFYFGWKIAGLPFVPFDIFDLLSRKLPGPIITFGIEHMVALIQALNLGEIGVVAKAAEQSMGIIIFLILGIIAGVVTNIISRIVKGAHVLTAAMLGFIFAIPVEIISLTHNNTSSVSLITLAIWIMAHFWHGALFSDSFIATFWGTVCVKSRLILGEECS